MADLNQGQTGSLKSTPKFVRVSGGTDSKVIYRSSGNSRAHPFLWATTLILEEGEDALSIGWADEALHGYSLALYTTVLVLPEADLGTYYLNRMSSSLEIRFSTAAAQNTNVSVAFMLGESFSTVSGINSAPVPIEDNVAPAD